MIFLPLVPDISRKPNKEKKKNPVANPYAACENVAVKCSWEKSPMDV